MNRLGRLEAGKRRAGSSGKGSQSASRRLKRERRPADLADLVETVLSSAGEMRVRDLHTAVQAIAGARVPASSLRNWLLRDAAASDGRVEHAATPGDYRLRP